MQAYYNLESENKGMDLIKYMAVLALEVRKSLGNNSTELHATEMLEWEIKDLRDFKEKGKYPDIKKYYQ
jgi:hypothetical protein